MTKQEKIESFNPNSAGLKDANIYGLPFTAEESDIVLIPVPWEVTTSYGAGTSEGPAHMLEASFQVDLYHPEFPELWKKGIAMVDIPEDMLLRSTDLKQKAARIIDMWEDGKDVPTNEEAIALQSEINAACEHMNQWVEEQVSTWLDAGKMAAGIFPRSSQAPRFVRNFTHRCSQGLAHRVRRLYVFARFYHV